MKRGRRQAKAGAERKRSIKSGKQRRTELTVKRQERAAAEANRLADIEKTRREKLLAGGAITPVNREALSPNRSYDYPDFVKRGHYCGVLFSCVDCGKEELWTAGQQKWWYEVAKGDLWTTARRCRTCRRRKREDRDEARRIHLEGLARKKKNRPAQGDER